MVQTEVMSRIDALVEEEKAEEEEDNNEETALFRKHSAARSISLLARMIEYHRGSRVETYAPLFAVATKLVSEHVLPAEDGAGAAALKSSKDNKSKKITSKNKKALEEEENRENQENSNTDAPSV